MMRYSGQLPFRFSLTPWVKRLLIINAVVFVLTWAAPQLVNLLAFRPVDLLFQPWTILTYMFVHGGFWHIFFNMLMLFFFGPPLEEKWGSSEFIKYYLICGIGGALFGFIFAPFGWVIGASGAVFGVMLAFAMNWPNSPIYIWGIFPVKAKWLVAFLAAVAFFSTFGGAGDGVAHFAHLGGLVFGFGYLKFGDAVAMRMSRASKSISRPRLSVTSAERSGRKDRPARSSREEERLLDEVDRVLDKISTSGLGSLSPEERKLLDEVSKRYRQN